MVFQIRRQTLAARGGVIRLFVFHVIVVIFISPAAPATTDRITSAAPVAIVNGTALVSKNGAFELGIYSPSSERHYLVIRCANAVVWVANREKPLPLAASEAGILKINTTTGTLDLVGGKAGTTVFWTLGKLRTGNTSLKAQLEDSGNFILSVTGFTLWQSFDYPTDTLLPGMRIGYDNRTRQSWSLRSWKAADDPTPGDYTYSLDRGPLPQLYIRGFGGTPTHSGYWSGESFSGVTPTAVKDESTPVFEYESDYPQWATFTYNITVAPIITRQVLNSSGAIEGFLWRIGGLAGWIPSQLNILQPPQHHGGCGANSVWVEDTTKPCQCLQGFDKAPQNDSCMRTGPLMCNGSWRDLFPIKKMNLPKHSEAVVDMSLGYEMCMDICAKNCSCIACSILNITKGCIFWYGDLLETQKVSGVSGHDLFIRNSGPPAPSHKHVRTGLMNSPGIIVAPILAIVILAGLIALFFFNRRRKIIEKNGDGVQEDFSQWGQDVPLFNFTAIDLATEGFSFKNILGRGGFGVVYKGNYSWASMRKPRLKISFLQEHGDYRGNLEGQEVAIKRLIQNSGQGLDEFMNEVKLIARVQHKNLVRLVGCCVEKIERILIYEYMQNQSLDKFLFEKQNRSKLSWERRVEITKGVARGLLYLHEDSRLRVVHRDLKAANILLDGSMNPKISDFGTARIFEANQQQVNTKTVIGTLGYMSPEYATLGIFSTKSDVFSFGVLLLEIITGVKNMKGKLVCNDNGTAESKYLPQMAWTLWQQENSLELLDSILVGTCSIIQVLRYIHIALLCVQESPDDRPTMSAVLLMLGADVYRLPKPTLPGNFVGKNDRLGKNILDNCQKESSFALTMTDVDGR